MRFHWHVEDGYGASVPAGGVQPDPGSPAVQHALVDIEVSGHAPGSVQALFSLPPLCLQDGQVKGVGLVLGAGLAPEEDWRGPLLTYLATHLAAAGFLVVRCSCQGAHAQQRLRAYEKALDVAATSPYARGVQRWLLGGLGEGARSAAVVAQRCRGAVAGLALLAYPLLAPLPTLAGEPLPDSALPLLRAQPAQRVLLLARVGEGSGAAGEQPAGAQPGAATAEQLREVAARMRCKDVRLVEGAGGDAGALAAPLEAFCTAVALNDPVAAQLPWAKPPGPGSAAPADVDPAEGRPDPLAYAQG